MNTSNLRCWCEVHLAAIGHNLKTLRSLVGPGPEIMCLVKADAYGHGLIPLSRYFEKHDCQILGCAHLREGIALRKAGIKMPVLLLSAPLASEYAGILRHDLMLAISSLDEARQAARAAVSLRRKARVHLKINTGMNRLGAEPPEFAKILKFVQTHPRMEIKGVFSHYASADSDRSFSKRQWTLFQQHAPAGIPRHICNSAGILNFPNTAGDIMRPGIAVYGLSPIAARQNLFKPALSWKSRVTFLRKVPRGARLSYGGTFRAPHAMQIAVVAAGYGDGLFRSLSNRGWVLIGGRRCRIVGRVTMDQILVDITGMSGIRNGAETVLIGRQKKETILASEMAEWAGTISYEILTHITDRVPKLHIAGPQTF